MKSKLKCNVSSDSLYIDDTISSSTGYYFNSRENLSPTIATLLPRNLLDSPVLNDQTILPSTSFLSTSKKKRKNSHLQIPIMNLKTEDSESKIQSFDDDNDDDDDDNNSVISSDVTISTTKNTNINQHTDKCFTGFYLKTTYSDVKFIIKDPFIIEKLVLLPMTKLFLYLMKKSKHKLNENESNYNCSKSTTVNTTTNNEINDYSSLVSSSPSSSSPSSSSSSSSSSSYSCQLIHSKRVLMELYENYIETYGYLKHAKLFVKYTLKDFPDCEEKSNLLKLLNKCDRSISLLNKSDEFSIQHKINNDTSDFCLNVNRIPSEYQFPIFSSSPSISSSSTTLCPIQSSSFSINDYYYHLHYQQDQLFSSDRSLNIINISPFELTNDLSEVNHFKSNYIIQTKPISAYYVDRKTLNKVPSDNSKSKNDSLFNIRYKTQVCRYFQEHDGYCPAGIRCHFAHGIIELRDPKSHPKFRSQICRNYSTTGNCSYGDKCYFKHFTNDSQSKTTVTTPKLEIFNDKENPSPDSTSQPMKHLINSKKK
ncbi:unnamed protein product [Schistosoma intercalatum]|nr:unnamed protein product [Schistosoma intercalatum]CAH8438573.1 unnamed protein product [Schistosoma intercalatum]